MSLNSVLYSDPCGLPALGPEWWALLEQSDVATPTLTPAWLESWWRVFGEGQDRQLRLWSVRDENTLVGLAPFLCRAHRYVPSSAAMRSLLGRQQIGFPMPSLTFRRLEPLGSGEPEEDEVCSDYLGLIAARGYEQSVAEAFGSALAKGDLGQVDEVLMPGMDGSAPMTQAIVGAFGKLGWTIEVSESQSSPYIELPASFEDYLETLPSSGRHLVTRSLRDFEKWSGGEVRWMRATDTASLERGQLVLRALHAERWTAIGERGAFASRRFSSFHELLMPLLLRRGALDLQWLEVRGVPIAALYNMVWRGRLSFYQSGRKMDVPGRVRPGIVIHANAIRGAISAGLREYDFLPGSQHYKLQLATSFRPVVSLRAARRSMKEGARKLVVAGAARWRAYKAAVQPGTTSRAV